MSTFPTPIPERGEIDVLGLGEISLDRLLSVSRWPAPGDKLSVGAAVPAPGGQIATAMLGCARLGLRAGVVGSVGHDEDGDRALAGLRAAGVDLAAVRRVAGVATRTALILVSDEDGGRAVLERRDQRLDLDDAALSAARIERARLLLVDGSDPGAALWAARAAGRAGIPVVADLDRVGPEVGDLLGTTNFPVVTREFAEEWGGTGHVHDGLERLIASGASLAVATCGAEGAVARMEAREIVSPAFPARVRDTTGAGDAFHAGFVFGLLEGLEPERILRVANATAALCCEALGAQAGLPTRAAVQAKVDGAGRAAGDAANGEGA